jgi:hypothetical protein
MFVSALPGKKGVIACDPAEQPSDVSPGRDLLSYERTWQMIALTRYFHVFISRVAAGLSAVLLSGWHIAKTRYVGALFGLVVHDGSPLSLVRLSIH